MKILVVSVGILLSGGRAAAQTTAPADTSLLASAVRSASQHYLAQAPESRLVNGVAYGTHVPSYVKGRPFYQTSDPQPGTLDYDGKHFEAVPLLYEQVQDQVLLYGPNQAEPLQLIRQKVQSFELAGHRFVRLAADSGGVVTDGFYDLVVAGPTRLWAKRAKKLNAGTMGYDIKGDYEEKTSFFIQQAGHFLEVATLNQTLTALTAKKAEMQAYARNNRLRFATDSREASLAALVKQYNSLVNP